VRHPAQTQRIEVKEVMALKKLLLIAPLILAVAACSTVKKVVVKDIPIEDQNAIHSEYNDRSAWTRGVIEDMGEGGSVPSDTKVLIVDVALHYNGAVTVQTLKKRNKIVHALDIERPLTPQKVHERLDELFWFKDPTLRQVDYIRKWGKKTARAIVDVVGCACDEEPKRDWRQGQRAVGVPLGEAQPLHLHHRRKSIEVGRLTLRAIEA